MAREYSSQEPPGCTREAVRVNMIKRRKLIGLAAALPLMLAIFVTSSVPSAAAAVPVRHGSQTVTMKGPISTKPQGPTPDNGVSGDCGTASAYIVNDFNYEGKVTMGLNSSIGNISSVDWSLDFYDSGGNYLTGKSGSAFPGTDNWSLITYQDFSPWGAGTYSVVFTATVYFANGRTCYVPPDPFTAAPTDATLITS